MKKSDVVKELIEEIRKYKELDYEGWDSYSAAPSNADTRKRAITFLEILAGVFRAVKLDMPELSVGPGVNGGVHVYYQHSSGTPYFMMGVEPGVGPLRCVVKREKVDKPQLMECWEDDACALLVSLVNHYPESPTGISDIP